MNMRTLACIAALSITPALFAVTTKYFQDAQSMDFKAGKTDNVVISNTGRITLGAEVRRLLDKRPDVTTLFDVRVLPTGEILAAGGPEGKLLIYRDKKWDVLYTADQPYIFSMELGPNGVVYLGTGGTAGRIIEFKMAGKEAKVLFENKDIQYIWNMKRLADGRLLAATGPTGKLFLVDGAGGKEIFACKQKNLQTVVVDADGTIYAGTDTDGIIYKIEARDGKYVSRALYDAREEEISALALDPAGNLYAATAAGSAGSDQARSYLTKPGGTRETTTAPTTTSAPTTAAAGKKKTSPTTTAAKPNQQPGPRPPVKFPEMLGGAQGPMSMPSPAGGKGNAVYRIDRSGFVSEVFRDQVNINSMIFEKGKLYLGTGPDGYVFAVDPATEEVTLFAKTEAGYVNALGLTPEDALVLATGNPGRVIQLGPGLAKSGTFTSKVFDAEQISHWGTIDVTTADSAAGGKVTIQTRTSVLANPDDPGWSEWSKPVSAAAPVKVQSPAARFIQYKLTFTPDGRRAPAVRKVLLAYMEDNRRPQVASVTVNTGQADKPAEAPEGAEGAPEAPPMPMMPAMPKPKIFRFMWKASDPNGDTLRYFVYLRRLDTPYWVQLEKDFTPPMMQWDPRSVPDGKYELKVVASDNLSNPVGLGLAEARISDPFTVDNTPPVVRNLTCGLAAGGQLLVQAQLTDEFSEISSASIVLNAGKNWQYIPPVDLLYDSKDERIDTTVPVEPADGPVMVTIKVTDRAGNSGYAWTLVPPAPHPSQGTDGVDTDEKH